MVSASVAVMWLPCVHIVCARFEHPAAGFLVLLHQLDLRQQLTLSLLCVTCVCQCLLQNCRFAFKSVVQVLRDHAQHGTPNGSPAR